MNSFEPGEYVRLRSGGRKMQVIPVETADVLPASPLVACEYRDKSRRILGFYAADALMPVQAPTHHEPAACASEDKNRTHREKATPALY